MKRAIVLFICHLLAVSSFAAVETSGYMEVELRNYLESRSFQEQFGGGVQASIAISPDWRIESPGTAFSFKPFLRLDHRDASRSHADVRELSFKKRFGRWNTLIGIDRVFWGVTESRHLVDVVNQDDLVEDLDGEEKLGQPMLGVGRQQHWGHVSAYFMPWFRERTFPGRKGRLRGPNPVETDHARFESSREHLDLAVRYTHSKGAWDIGGSAFLGTGREPTFVRGESKDELIPFYQQVSQVGVDLQYTSDAWLWKFEGIVRKGQGRTFFAAVAGLEYTIYQALRSAGDLGLLLEFLCDRRDPVATPPTIFDNDVFFGMRWAANDTQNSTVLAGLLVDLQDSSSFVQLEAKTRIGRGWVGDFEARLFMNVDRRNTLAPVATDSHFQLRLTHHY